MFFLIMTACQEIHIPEASAVDRQARLLEFESMLNEENHVKGNISNGEAIYTQTCKACHGQEGKDENFGSESVPIWIGTSAVTDPTTFFEITNFGDVARKMPGYYDTYGLTDLIDVVAYSQTLPSQ